MKTINIRKRLIMGLLIGLGATVSYENVSAHYQCSQVFPGAVQTTSNNGEYNNNNKIIFSCGTQIQGNPSNVLRTDDVDNPSSSCATKTCGTQNCADSSSIVGKLYVGYFETSSGSGGSPTISGTQTLGGTNNSITDYNSVVLNSASTLNFSTKSSGVTTYRFNTITMNANSTINLQPGDYWVSNLNINDDSTINVVGNGTARLYVKNSVSISSSKTISWNAGGSASKLLVYGFDNFDFGGTGSVIKAVIYSEEKVTLRDNLIVTGAITAEKIILNNTAKVIYDSNAASNMDFNSTCIQSSTTSQFGVSAPSTGTNCQNMTITVTAKNASGQTVTNYTGSVTLTTQTGSGTWVSTAGDGAFNGNSNGTATYTFVASDSGSATFQLNYPASGSVPVTIKVYQTNNTGISGLSGTINFVPASLLITDTVVANPPAAPPPAFATTETAGTNFTLYLTAYNPSSCGIVTSYTGTKNIRFYTTYLNPTTGTINATINGTAIASSSGAAATTQSITFTNGVATVTMRYNDAGQLKLNAIDTATNPAGPTGVSGNFVVKPASFVLNVPASTASQTQTAAACLTNTVFAKAGNNFTVNVQARNALGSVTPNYGNETSPQGIILTSGAIYGPTNARNGSANNGAIANGNVLPKITSGSAPTGWSLPYFQGTTLSFDEVGCINLTANVLGGNYLGAANGAVTGSLVVGRFTPDHFDASGLDASNNPPQFKTTCSNGTSSFTYLDQPFLYARQPVLKVTAYALGNTITQNYTGSFWKLSSNGFASVYNKAYFPVNSGDVIAALTLSATIPTPTFVDIGNGNATATGAGTGTFTFSDGGGLKIQRLNSTLVPAFTAEIQLRIANITDSDTVPCTGTGCSTGGFSFGATTSGNGIVFSGAGGGKQFYHGRLVVLDASGPENAALLVPMQTQFYTTAGGFILNTLDTGSSGNCTAYTGGANNIDVTTSTGLSTTPTVLGSPNYYFSNGALNISLSAPTGSATTGYADLEAKLQASTGANLPWLQYNWPYAGSSGVDFTANPRGRGSFGIFKGNDRIIYQKEITQ